MAPALRAYVASETMISIVINAVLSALPWLPRNLPLRALLAAIGGVTLFASLGTLLIAAIAPDPLAMSAVWPMKILYGALVALIVTPLALCVTLGEEEKQ